MKPTCASCMFFVEQNAKGEYTHELAVKNGSGFCVMQELFAQVFASDTACKEYVKDRAEK